MANLYDVLDNIIKNDTDVEDVETAAEAEEAETAAEENEAK